MLVTPYLRQTFSIHKQVSILFQFCYGELLGVSYNIIHNPCIQTDVDLVINVKHAFIAANGTFNTMHKLAGCVENGLASIVKNTNNNIYSTTPEYRTASGLGK